METAKQMPICRECGAELREIKKPTELGMWPIGVALCRCEATLWEMYGGAYRDVFTLTVRDVLVELADELGFDVPYQEE